MKYIIYIILLISCGCIHENIQINTTKQWEGHFMDTKTFYEATRDIKLNKKESIWVLSNRTLNTVLKNIDDKTKETK